MSCANPEKNKIFFLEVVMNAIPQMNWIQRNYKNKQTEMKLILNLTNVFSTDFDLPLTQNLYLDFYAFASGRALAFNLMMYAKINFYLSHQNNNNRMSNVV